MASTFLPYAVKSAFDGGNRPAVVVGKKFGSHPNATTFLPPPNAPTNSCWILIISANDPRKKVMDWVLPQNSTVPGDIGPYMDNSGNIFVVATNALEHSNLPQGALYDFLVKYGGGKELQMLEQYAASLGYIKYNVVSYVLTGTCGPRTKPPAPSYEAASCTDIPAFLLLSLMSAPNGGPPYGIADNYSWT